MSKIQEILIFFMFSRPRRDFLYSKFHYQEETDTRLLVPIFGRFETERESRLIVTSSGIDKMFEIFGPIFEQNANVNFEPIFEQNVNFGLIFEKNAYFGAIFVKIVNFEDFVSGR